MQPNKKQSSYIKQGVSKDHVARFLASPAGSRWTFRFRGARQPGETLQTMGRKCRALVPQLPPRPLKDKEASAESAAGAANVRAK